MQKRCETQDSAWETSAEGIAPDTQELVTDNIKIDLKTWLWKFKQKWIVSGMTPDDCDWRTTKDEFSFSTQRRIVIIICKVTRQRGANDGWVGGISSQRNF